MGGTENEFYSKPFVVLCWLIAAIGGLMFGYDIGISGGVTSMDDFLIMFFPGVYAKKKHAKENNYCKYADPYVQLFTSSLYLAALCASFIGSKVCSKYGRKMTMLVASIFYLLGVTLNAAANGLVMLILGRILLGVGVGFGNEAVPLFLSEIAPIKIRGAVNILFQLFVTTGILIANVINYVAAEKHPWGWRLALGLAGVPAFMLLVGSFVIPETPTSLIERGHVEKGKLTLQKIRRTQNVEEEYQSILTASRLSQETQSSFSKLMRPSSRPPLVIGIMMQVFQQFTGINAIMFYAPVLFQTVGFGANAALISSVIIGFVNVFSTLVSIKTVDKFGRRALLLEACCQMFLTQVVVGIILAVRLKITGTLGHREAIGVVILVCLYVMSFAWSWGPLGWLIPSETFPLEIRTTGFAFAVSANMLCTFIIAQAFLSMLCHMHAFVFFFFAAWIVAMGLFVIFLLPETKGVPIEDMVERVWKQHWFWKNYMDRDVDANGQKVRKEVEC
ncbi:hypothetical protein C5167_041546 [Papaver somniferum]|uniref:sugar transport protein 8-like n=1 Tax=Papaver somniferum TaxID=3469 RepID=UPI000E6F7036|nr:sugar transport protein 8-like [Papaver somniferum]RZC85366.1 hypothetical protein C5167_041546 [Papaver somniferum]